MAVPADWPVQHTSSLGGCGSSYRTLASPSAVVFDTGTLSTALERCPAGPAELPVGQEIAANGIVIDPGPYGPLQGNDSFGRCLHINDVTACPTATNHYGVSVLTVDVPANNGPTGVNMDRVAVEIGLAGNGMVARTMLYSMRAAGSKSKVPLTLPSTTSSSTTSPTQLPPRTISAQPLPVPQGIEGVLPVGTVVPIGDVDPRAASSKSIMFGLANDPGPGSTYPAVSTDGGLRWEIAGPRFVYAAAQAASTVSDVIALPPDGATF